MFTELTQAMIVNGAVLTATLHSDLGRARKIGPMRLLRPALIAATIVPLFIDRPTTHGTGLAIEIAGTVAGVLGGLAALGLMKVYRSQKTGKPVSRATWPYALLWTLVIGVIGIIAAVQVLRGLRLQFVAEGQDAQGGKEAGVVHPRELPGAGDTCGQVGDHQVVHQVQRAHVGDVPDQSDPRVDLEDGDQQQAGDQGEVAPVAATAAQFGDACPGRCEGEGEDGQAGHEAPPAEIDPGHQGRQGEDQRVGEDQQGGGGTHPELRPGVRVVRALRGQRDGHEQQADQGAARLGRRAEELAVLLRDHGLTIASYSGYPAARLTAGRGWT